MCIQIALLQDLGNAIRNKLSADGHDVSSIETDDHKTLVAWHKLNRYAIDSHPREVHRADNFDPAGHETGVSNLENAIQSGDDLSIFMSRRIGDITKTDGLLDHWGIHHFHLGESRYGRSGEVERTKHVLLCRITPENAYFIEVAAHGSDSPNTWYRQDLIDIIHRNWPESIERARLKGVTDIAPDFTDDDVKILRQANLTHFLKVSDGTVYIEPGIGVMGDGTHWDDLTFADSIRRTVADIETRVLGTYPSIMENANRLGYRFAVPANFALGKVQFGQYWDIVETTSNYLFRIYEK